jgi:hypothetical protein
MDVTGENNIIVNVIVVEVLESAVAIALVPVPRIIVKWIYGVTRSGNSSFWNVDRSLTYRYHHKLLTRSDGKILSGFQ